MLSNLGYEILKNEFDNKTTRRIIFQKQQTFMYLILNYC